MGLQCLAHVRWPHRPVLPDPRGKQEDLGDFKEGPWLGAQLAGASVQGKVAGLIPGDGSHGYRNDPLFLFTSMFSLPQPLSLQSLNISGGGFSEKSLSAYEPNQLPERKQVGSRPADEVGRPGPPFSGISMEGLPGRGPRFCLT